MQIVSRSEGNHARFEVLRSHYPPFPNIQALGALVSSEIARLVHEMIH